MTKFPPLERPETIAKAINPQYLTEEQPLVRSLADRARLSEAAARNAALGFDIMAVGSDWAFLTAGAQAALKTARGSSGPKVAQY